MLQAGRSRIRLPISMDFSIYLILPAALRPCGHPASKRNEYQESSWEIKGGRRVKLTSPPLWEPRRLTTLWAYTACHRDSFTFTFMSTAVQRWKGRGGWNDTLPCFPRDIEQIGVAEFGRWHATVFLSLQLYSVICIQISHDHLLSIPYPFTIYDLPNSVEAKEKKKASVV
jgi:hypothetical protein